MDPILAQRLTTYLQGQGFESIESFVSQLSSKQIQLNWTDSVASLASKPPAHRMSTGHIRGGSPAQPRQNATMNPNPNRGGPPQNPAMQGQNRGRANGSMSPLQNSRGGAVMNVNQLPGNPGQNPGQNTQMQNPNRGGPPVGPNGQPMMNGNPQMVVNPGQNPQGQNPNRGGPPVGPNGQPMNPQNRGGPMGMNPAGNRGVGPLPAGRGGLAPPNQSRKALTQSLPGNLQPAPFPMNGTDLSARGGGMVKGPTQVRGGLPPGQNPAIQPKQPQSNPS